MKEGKPEWQYTDVVNLVLCINRCCNLSAGVALIVRFATNGMCVKNNTIIYVARASNSKRECEQDLYCCLLPRCEALRTCPSGFPIAALYKFAYVQYMLPFLRTVCTLRISGPQRSIILLFFRTNIVSIFQFRWFIRNKLNC